MVEIQSFLHLFKLKGGNIFGYVCVDDLPCYNFLSLKFCRERNFVVWKKIYSIIFTFCSIYIDAYLYAY